MNGISFHVYGTPTPKGSTTRMPNGATLPAGTPASRLRMATWHREIRDAARIAMDDHAPFRGPIRLMVEFAFQPPATTIRKYQWGWLPHTKRPDVDKLFRALGDALTGIVWIDDSQVCVSAINKVYAWDGRSGCHVIVDEIDDATAKLLAHGHAVVDEAMATVGDHDD